MRTLAVIAILAAPASAIADDQELDRARLVYARGGALYKSDGHGRGETQLAPLPGDKPVVRALRTDPKGSVLLADVAGTWYWMALDGGKLVQLPCADGPAQLDVDGSCVICKSAAASQIVNLKTGKVTPIDVPDAHIAGSGSARKLVWADAGGIWTAPVAAPRARTKVAPEAPLRGFLPAPDGSHAVGVYADEKYENVRKKVPVDVLMTFALDGTAARRKLVREAIPLDWTPDGQYALVQDGTSACMVRTNGGESKCYKGFTAVGIAPDASYVLMLGSKDLYRGRLDGLYDSSPILTVKSVAGAAVWIPGH